MFISFCLLCLAAERDDFTNLILWSNEVQFKLNENVNKHNCVYYIIVNTHLVEEIELNFPGFTEYGGISLFDMISIKKKKRIKKIASLCLKTQLYLKMLR